MNKLFITLACCTLFAACSNQHQQKEKAEKEIMLDLITQIVARLNEINDGSFIIEDFETERLKAL